MSAGKWRDTARMVPRRRGYELLPAERLLHFQLRHDTIASLGYIPRTIFRIKPPSRVHLTMLAPKFARSRAIQWALARTRSCRGARSEAPCSRDSSFAAGAGGGVAGVAATGLSPNIARPPSGGQETFPRPPSPTNGFRRPAQLPPVPAARLRRQRQALPGDLLLSRP